MVKGVQLRGGGGSPKMEHQYLFEVKNILTFCFYICCNILNLFGYFLNDLNRTKQAAYYKAFLYKEVSVGSK